VLSIRALDAWEEGVDFYDRHSLWLAEEVALHLIDDEGHFDDGEDPRERLRGEGSRGRAPRRGFAAARDSGESRRGGGSAWPALERDDSEREQGRKRSRREPSRERSAWATGRKQSNPQEPEPGAQRPSRVRDSRGERERNEGKRESEGKRALEKPARGPERVSSAASAAFGEGVGDAFAPRGQSPARSTPDQPAAAEPAVPKGPARAPERVPKQEESRWARKDPENPATQAPPDQGEAFGAGL